MSVPIEVQPHQVGHKVWPQAFQVFPDEKALLLIERDENRPDSRGFHRYQTIFVARNDELAKYMEDMGPTQMFIAPGLNIPGGDPASPVGQWWETVAELKGYADDLREWLANRVYRHEVADLVSGYHDLIDQEARESRHQSQFGPLYKIQRG